MADKNIIRTLKRVYDGIEKRGNKDLKGLGLTLNQCAVLGYLAKQQNFLAPIKTIEKDFGVSQATMQGNISRLVKKGFISLIVDADDRRIKQAMLTDQGKECWAIAEQKRIASMNYLFGDFSEQEKEILKMLLQKIYNKLD